MKRETVNYVQAGLAVVLAGALLFWILLRITGGGGDLDRYVIYYGNVAGLRFGTPVYYEGYRVGEIQSVRPDREGPRTRYRVEIGIEEGWGVPVDSVAQISASGILGDVAINITEGADRRMLEPDDEIQGEQGGDIFAAFNSLAGEVQTLADGQLEPLLELLRARLDEFTTELTQSTPSILQEVRELLESLNRTAGALDQILSDDNVRSMDAMIGDVAAASRSLRDVAGTLDGSRRKVEGLLTELETLVAESRPDVQATVAELRNVMGILEQRLDGITAQLDTASRNVNEFTRTLRRDPSRLLRSAEADDSAEAPLQ